MKTVFRKQFLKAIEKLNDTTIKDKIFDSIVNVECAERTSEIADLKKLSGHKHAYRIRIGDYRIGLAIMGDTVTFAAFGHRREIYRLFP